MVAKSPDTLTHVVCEGYGAFDLDFADLAPRHKEDGTSAALVRGVACGLGCAVVSGLAASATKELLSFPLVGKNNEREIYMIRARDRRPTKSARAFIDFLLSRRALH